MDRICACFLLVMIMLACVYRSACAAAVPSAKEIEKSYAYESETLSIAIDRWRYDFPRTQLRFFVARVRTDKPSNRDLLLVMEDGSFVGVPMARQHAGQGRALVHSGVRQSFAFGPLLVMDGCKTELPRQYIIYTKDTIREPRTGIGWTDDGEYVLVVADGRRAGWSDKGMTLQEMQDVFCEQGCRGAYNLDGGGSATLYFDGQRLNRTSGAREREVSDIVYFIK